MPGSSRIRGDGLTSPLATRFSHKTLGFDQSMAAHAGALEDGEDYYIDPQSGLLVMTAQYLADRGPCCGNDCRHCPFE